MKVCVISTPVFSLSGEGGLQGYGGLEQIAWLTAKGLAELGHEVALVAPEGSACPGVTVIPNGQAGTWDEKNAYNAYWAYLPQFDVIISHDWQKWSYILKQEGVLKAPVLGVMHAPVDTMYAQLPPVDKPCIVCISEDQGAHFRALFSRDCRVAYNGIDTEFYRPLGVPRSDRFLFLARFSAIKGAHLAVEACLKAGVGLDLVGDTSITNEPAYLDQIRRAADGEQIRLVGPATRGETVWWFSQAYAMLHPVKEFREPFGLAPVEAMACGCPVIAWDKGACRETVGKGHAGVLCTSVDDMVAAINLFKKANLAPLRKHCQEVAGTFSVERMARRYEELCKEAIETGGW